MSKKSSNASSGNVPTSVNVLTSTEKAIDDGLTELTLVASNQQLHKVLATSLNGDAGFHLHRSETATACLETLDKSNSKIVFVDLILEDMDGLSLIEEIRSRYRCLHIVAIMCKNELAAIDLPVENIKIMAAQSGANAVFLAPFNLAELLTTIERFCEAAAEPTI